jgi:uncharacterized protein (TIGR02246 family)
MNTYTQDVLDLVERWAHAELAGDVDAYADLLDEEFVGVGPVGFVLDKQQWAQRHRGDLENHAFEIIEPHVRLFGETAIVEAVQRQETTAVGRDTSGSFRVVIVAVNRGDRWAIAHIQLSGPLIAPGEMPSFAR